MDIKDLNKSQLILLALLLSFVTSIATGITTVTLMQQAPESVTVPINKVVRETVEKIVQVPGSSKTETIIIKEEDLVVEAISKNTSLAFSVVKETTDQNGSPVDVDSGRGFLISKDGVVAADGALVFSEGKYKLKGEKGEFEAEFVPTVTDMGVGFLKINLSEEQKSSVSFSAPAIGSIEKMKAGQKVLILGKNINSFIFEGNQDFKEPLLKQNPGAMVLNLDGELLGIALSGDKFFVSGKDLAI